jgi:hypothetical protein
VQAIDSGTNNCRGIHLMLHQGDSRGFLAAKNVVDPEGGSEVLSWLDAAERGDGPPYHPLAVFVRIAFRHAFRHLLLASSYEQAIQAGNSLDYKVWAALFVARDTTQRSVA